MGKYGRFGKKDTDWFFPINQPGISVMMLPFYALSQIFKERVLIFIIKGSLSIWAALLGVQLFLLANDLWKKEKLSLVLWFLFSLSSPVLFYAFHLYPEIPIALFSVYLFRKILAKGPFSTRQYMFFGFVLSLFIWFGLKYNMIFWPILLSHPSFLYQPTTHKFTFRGGEFFINMSNLGFYLPNVLPSFIKVNNLGYWPNYVWLGLFVLFFLGYIRKPGPQKTLSYPRHTIFIMVGLLLLFVWFSLFPQFTLLNPVNVGYDTGEKITFYSLERYQQMRGPGKFLLFKDVHTYIFNFTSWRELKDITIDFGSLDGTFLATLKLFDSTLFEGETSKEMKTLRIPAPAAYRYKKTNLYMIRLELTNMSEFLAADKPYLFTIQPSD